VDRNCDRVRAVILKYIQDRKSGKRKSKFEGGVDVLSLFFENPEIFTDEFIVDELCDFFVAASSTTQYTTQTLVTHLIKDPNSLAKLRSEVDALKADHLPPQPPQVEGQSKEGEKTEDLEKLLAKVITLESIQDLEY
jgi:cytochrome P450